MKRNNTPLISITKRLDLKKEKGYLIRVICVVAAFLFSILLSAAIIGKSPLLVAKVLFEGGTKQPLFVIYKTAMLLGFGLAIVPAFKMKFWNMGANGQVLVGALAACMIMFYSKPGTKTIAIAPLMILASILASIIWAVIPALFKAFFNTNETLFTLMMNYIAIELVAYCNYIMAQGGHETPGIIQQKTKIGWVTTSATMKYVIPIIVICFLVAFIYFYIKKTKHGFEIEVLGDSPATARYSGMDTKWITIRTMILSGAICGIIGYIYAACVDHSCTATMVGSQGFTAVLVAWLSNFNPFIMAGISLLLIFLTEGTSRVSAQLGINNNELSNVFIGIIFFAILIAEFFVRYKLKFNKHKEEEAK